MSVGLDAKNASTLRVKVDEYGIRHRIHGASDTAGVPRVEDFKVIGAEVLYRLGDSTLDEDDIDVDDILVVDIRVPTPDDSQLFRATLQAEGEASNDYDYTSDASATEDEILDGLESAIDGNDGYRAKKFDHGGDKLLRVWRDGDLKTFTVALSAGGVGVLTQETKVSRADAVLFGGVISRRALQRDLQKAAASGIALSHIGLKTRAGTSAVVWISFVTEVSLGHFMESPRKLTGV